MRNLFYIILIFSIPFPKSSAQELLTLENAIEKCLENNFDLKIAKNEVRIASENLSIGNAGMLPRVNGIITNNNTILNIDQTFANGENVEIDGAQNININYGVGLEWTIFDGFRMFARNKQLKESLKLSESELRVSILTRLSEVYETYFQLVNFQKQIQNIDSIISVSEFRLKTAQNRFTIGKASKLEVLNAEVDLNTDKSLRLTLQEQFQIVKVQLNQLLVQPPQFDFKVDTKLVLDQTLKFDEINELALQQNPKLQVQFINQKIQEYELKQVKANRYPIVTLTSGYNLVRSQTPFGFVTESTGRNINYGFTATLNIFDGFNQNRNEKVAKIQLENSQILIEQQKQSIQSQVAVLFQSYLSGLALLDLEKQNENIAKQNLNITLEKFKIGSISTVEFRTAQENYTNAVMRLNNAELTVKLTEINLKELAGSLTVN
ncbi:TolC family protein [Flavobacterium sp.]|uniref:TolC family protein n=1 Tax=Flavobacterium sp. TaxID=239 RepID=UPI002FD9B142